MRQEGLQNGRISPLRTAAWFGYLEIVRVLLQHGANPSEANPETGKTALDIALAQGHREVAKLLRDRPRWSAGKD